MEQGVFEQESASRARARCRLHRDAAAREAREAREGREGVQGVACVRGDLCCCRRDARCCRRLGARLRLALLCDPLSLPSGWSVS